MRATRREALTGLAFVLPFAVFLLCFGVAPSTYALVLSFHKVGGSLLSFTLAAYRYAFADPNFGPAVRHVIEFSLIVTPVALLLVTALALLLQSRSGVTAKGVSLLYFLPGAVSGSVAVLLWLLMLDPLASPFRWLLHAFGWTSIVQVLSNGNLMWIFAVMFLWAVMGGWIVITTGALRNIPREIDGAAQIDGCGPLALAFYIHLPMIKKTLILMAILVFAAASEIYTEPTVLATFTQNTVPWGLNQLSYRYAFEFGMFEAAAAVAMMLVVITVAVAAIVVWRLDFVKDLQS
jgi:multiple sugar transport system permease protein